jgi:hypothetical protein
MGKPVDREKRKKAARMVILRAWKDGQRLKNIKGLRELLAEETAEMDYPDEYVSALTPEDLTSLLCEAGDTMATPSHASGSPPPPVPMAPQVSAAPGLSHTVGPHTSIGPGNSLTPAPSQQDGQSQGLKDLGQSGVSVEEETVTERCMEDVPDFEQDVSGLQSHR